MGKTFTMKYIFHISFNYFFNYMQLVKCKYFALQRGSFEEKHPLTQGRTTIMAE